MIDFKIQRGRSEQIFTAPGVPNPRLIIEEGCWYLCTDTAELYLGIKENDDFTLKQINGTHDAESVDPAVLSALEVEINSIKESLNDFAKKTELPSLEGLATETFVQEELNKITIPDVSNFITEEELAAKGYLTEHQDISGKAEKDHTHSLAEIVDYVAPDFTGYATQEFVHQAIAAAELEDKEADLEAYYTKSEVNALIPDVSEFIKESDLSGYALKSDIPDITGKADSDHTHEEYATKDHTHTEYAEAEHTHDEYLTEHQSLEDYAKKADIPSLEGYATKTELFSGSYNDLKDKPEIPSLDGYATEEYVDDAIAEHAAVKAVATTIIPVVEKVNTEVIPVVQELAEKAATQEWVQDQKYLQNKYEVLPIDGMLISYRDNEIRLNTARVQPFLQNVGATGNANLYYATFRAYAPDGATRVIEGSSGKMDSEFSALATDSLGRKYTTIWAAIAATADGGQTWTKWGDDSTLDKYLGFYYNFHWYNKDTLINIEKVRVILTNDNCHDDLVPDVVARRIDDKVAAVSTTINTISQQITNIEENYVTNDILETSYVTNEALQENYTTTVQLEAKVAEVIQEKVEAGEIKVTADTINYDTW